MAQYPEEGTVTGIITDKDARPVRGATVRILDTSPARGAISKEDGSFTITGIPTDLYDIGISAIGYRSRTISKFRITADSASYLNLVLEAAPAITGDTVTTACTLRDIIISENLGTITRIRFDEDGSISMHRNPWKR